MKIVCTHKITGKRILVSTKEEPNYKDIYNNEAGKPFELPKPEIFVTKPKKVVAKPKKTITKRPTVKKSSKKTK